MMFRQIIATFLLFSVTLIAAVNQPPPRDSFVSRTHQGSKTVVNDGERTKVSISKVFWTLQEGGYTYGKKRVFGNRENGYYRVQFACCACKKEGFTLSCYASVEVLDPDHEESDVFTLISERYPLPSEHRCVASGMEALSREFHLELLQQIRIDPCQAMPGLYNSVRY